MQRLQPADAPPVCGGRGIAQKGREQGFVVALQRDEVGRKRVARQAVDDPSGVGAAVDVVAQRHRERILDRPGIQITRNAGDHAIKKIGPAVNIADDIEPTWLRKW